MKKVIFILPYFGKFNNYFQLFLNSCRKNPDFDWLIFTDDRREFDYPKNVKIVWMSFDEFRGVVREKINNGIRLDSARKLCDFRPCYGYIFEDYIREYNYWGYCDCDLIFGNLKKYINDETLCDCDKFGVLGHLTLIKNTKGNNRLFFSNNIYKKVFSNPNGCNFDEAFVGSINNIFRSENKKIVRFSDFADIYTKSSTFRITHFFGETLRDFNIEKKNSGIFVWNDGVLERISCNDKKIKKEEYAYIHLQKRKMKIKIPLDSKIYKIIPNAFELLDGNLNDCSSLKKMKKYNLNMHYFRLRFKNLKDKIGIGGVK